jgi:glycosyltransferase involved in cell wall biosynthesis
MKQRRIKVAYLLTPITFGGAEKVSLNFLQHVNRDRFEVYPILLVRPWERESYFVRELGRRQLSYATVPVARKSGGDPWRVPRAFLGIHRILRQAACDLLHTHGYFADLCGIPAARMLGLATVATCHGYISADRKLQLYNRLDKLVLRACGKIIAVSDGIRGELVASGLRPERIVTIKNAVPLPGGEEEVRRRRRVQREAGTLDEGDFVLGYVGRLSSEKGVRMLIEAVSILRNEGKPIRLVVVGDGPERCDLEELARQKSLADQVWFAGFQEEVGGWLPAFDAFVLPSLTEGTPLALLEAMAMGVPVIATAVGGVPKVVTDGINGLLVQAGDALSLAERIRDLQASPSLRERLSRRGREEISARYNIHHWCGEIERLYLDHPNA